MCGINRVNPFILAIGVLTIISHEITAQSLLPRVCGTILFIAKGHVRQNIVNAD
jgi:hypothetical protein